MKQFIMNMSCLVYFTENVAYSITNVQLYLLRIENGGF
jgi:hypothetical protein